MSYASTYRQTTQCGSSTTKTLFATAIFLAVITVQASEYKTVSRDEFRDCQVQVHRELAPPGGCGTMGCLDEDGNSVTTICIRRIGYEEAPPADEASEMIKALQEGGPPHLIRAAQAYAPDTDIGHAFARHLNRIKASKQEDSWNRGLLINDWRFAQEGDFITIEGTTNRSGELISAAVQCDGEYVGNALGGIQGGGTFTMLINNVPRQCKKLSLSRVSID